jgi:hypothetical protein
MVSIFRGVCGYVCVVCHIMLWRMQLSDKPMIYVSFGWCECVYVIGCDVIEASSFKGSSLSFKGWVV